ncbi:MAG: TIGR02679 family protein [Solirubrobacteraceae bacterium]
MLRAAAARLERNGLRVAGRLRLAELSEEEIRGLSGLLGSRWRAVLPGATASVDLAALDAAMRASPRFPGGLLQSCSARAGAPLVDRRAARLSASEARESGWSELRSHPALQRHLDLEAWLERERAIGTATRTGCEDPFGVLRRALDVLAALPANPPQTLARFAASRCHGDPHALDRDRPLDTAVRRALALLDGDTQPGGGAQARRARYDRWGLGCDELSSTVLCLGVWPGSPDPRVLTLRELRGIARLACGSTVFTCENPDVVTAAADALGPHCPPLVCTNGWPSTACMRLLRATIEGGAAVRHHGDMDPEGLRILDRLIATTNGRLWRMSPEEYRRHAANGGALTERRALSAPGNAPLARLASAMAVVGRIVQEEQTVVDLLSDLRATMRA